MVMAKVNVLFFQQWKQRVFFNRLLNETNFFKTSAKNR